MLVSFSVSNFRSFLTEETLSMVASSRYGGVHESHTLPIPGSNERVLRAAILYGANGAGKSNLFRALSYFISLAAEARGRGTGTGRVPFRFSETAREASTFDIQFIAGSRLYRLGMRVTDSAVQEEWLVQIDGDDETVIYERVTGGDGRVTVQLNSLEAAGEKLTAMATVGGPGHQSFLATVRATLDRSEWGRELEDVIDWLRNFAPVAASSEHQSLARELAVQPGLRQFAGEFLKDASTGVDHLEVTREEISKDTFRRLLPAAIQDEMPDQLPNGKSFHLRLNDDTEIQVERSNGDTHYYTIKIRTAHDVPGSPASYLDLSEESDGTKRLLELLPVLHYLRSETAVVFIDEIERSMHPNLVRRFLRFFLEGEARRGQIIATTHQADLLDIDILRRDEFWFVEKDRRGASRLYSLAEFKERDDRRIREHYLQGRFGAVPFLTDLDRIRRAKTNEPHPS